MPSPLVKLRPSDAHRWTACTASPLYIAQLTEQGLLPEEQVRDYTDEGSRAHTLAEQTLRSPEPGPSGDKYVDTYVNFVLSRMVNEECELLVEHQVKPFFLSDRQDGRGFIDAIVVNPASNVVDIVDLKYGKGVSVDAVDNHQLAIYAQSFVSNPDNQLIYGIDDTTLVRLIIVQPRAGEGDDDYQPVKMWNLTVGELQLWVDNNIDPYVWGPEGLEPHSGAFFKPSGDTCRFCPAKAVCRAYTGFALGEFDDGEQIPMDKLPTVQPITSDTLPQPVDYKTLEPSRIGKILQAAPKLKKWLDELEQYVIDTRLTVEGFKFVESRTNRRWDDEDKALEFLKRYGKVDEVSTRKVLSVAQADKFMAGQTFKRNADKIRAEFEALIVKPEGRLTLAPLSDKRPAILAAAQEFDDLTVEVEAMLPGGPLADTVADPEPAPTPAKTPKVRQGTSAKTTAGTPVVVLGQLNQRHVKVSTRNGDAVVDIDDLILPSSTTTVADEDLL